MAVNTTSPFNTESATSTSRATTKQNERRRCRRYPGAELHAELKIKKGLFGEWVSVEPCDYNKRGIAIETEHTMPLSQPVTLKLVLQMDMGDIKVDKVEGVIKNRIDDGPHPRYGIEFDYTASRHMKSLDTKGQLGRIEGILERSHELRKRMSDQDEKATN